MHKLKKKRCNGEGDTEFAEYSVTRINGNVDREKIYRRGKYYSSVRNREFEIAQARITNDTSRRIFFVRREITPAFRTIRRNSGQSRFNRWIFLFTSIGLQSETVAVLRSSRYLERVIFSVLLFLHSCALLRFSSL